MYGLILENMANFIKSRYGQKMWQEVQFVSGLEQDSFDINETYPEGLARKIIWGAQDVTGLPLDRLTESIGESFYEFTAKYEYHKFLRVLGRRFTDFLNGLDNLHEYLRFSYPNLKPPSFYCEHESRTGLTLHYRSKRRGFLHYVKGQIKNIAMVLYKVDLKIELLDHESEDHTEHAIMRLHFNNVDFEQKGKQETIDEDYIRSRIRFTSDMFFDIFPFVIVFNRGMRIRNVGVALMRSLPRMAGKRINQEFVLIRPLIRFRWEEITLYSNNIFELMTVEPVWEGNTKYIFRAGDAKELEEERRRMLPEHKQRFLTLKGQMVFMEEWESICFLGTPVMYNLAQLISSGLYINDFAMHDSSRDLVLAATQQAAELKMLLDQESKRGSKIQDSTNRLKEERERTDQLLYQLLPRAVADQLRKGASAVSTCETFDIVTILFTDVVGFTTICSGLQPMSVVQLLNQMYSVFDSLTERHGVFKLETIGDAYVIVGGAPTKTEFHAELVCDCALSIISSTLAMVEQTTRKAIRIRVGVHSGSVVAGVVGLKMPRYCLFGETVVYANQMEQTGEPMRVQISTATKRALDELDPKLFKTKPHNHKDAEGRPMNTFWLEGKNGPPRDPPPTPPVAEDEFSVAADEDGASTARSSYITPVSDFEIPE